MSSEPLLQSLIVRGPVRSDPPPKPPSVFIAQAREQQLVLMQKQLEEKIAALCQQKAALVGQSAALVAALVKQEKNAKLFEEVQKEHADLESRAAPDATERARVQAARTVFFAELDRAVDKFYLALPPKFD